MAPAGLQAAFRVALLILLTALAMLPFQPAGSATQVVTVMAAVVGALFVGAVWLVARWSAPPIPPRQTGAQAGGATERRTVGGGIDQRRPDG